MNNRSILFIITLVLSMSSCNKLDIAGIAFGSSVPVDKRFERSMEYNGTHALECIQVDSDDYTVYVATDAHVPDGEGQLKQFVGDYLADQEATPFALFLGDGSGKKDGYLNFSPVISQINQAGRKLFCAIGNHDIYFGQWERYFDILKTSTYHFEVETPTQGKDLYICLDSAEGTIGTKQRAWLEELFLADVTGTYRKIIVFTHTHFFKPNNDQGHTGNYNLEEGYDLEKFFADNGVDVVLAGHSHSFQDVTFKGVRYFTLASLVDDGGHSHYYRLQMKKNETILTSFRIK